MPDSKTPTPRRSCAKSVTLSSVSAWIGRCRACSPKSVFSPRTTAPILARCCSSTSSGFSSPRRSCMTPTTREVDERDFTPGTDVIRYMRQQSLTWPVALKELIDNAIDVGATRIWLSFGKDRVRIQDNGNGCADLLAMLRLG